MDDLVALRNGVDNTLSANDIIIILRILRNISDDIHNNLTPKKYTKQK